MKFVPSIPPPITVVREGLKVETMARVKSAKPVQERNLPPLVVRHHTPPEKTFDPREMEDMRHDTHLHGERRKFCRRSEHLPVLVELRSEIDRRQHKQRELDETEHIDVEA